MFGTGCAPAAFYWAAEEKNLFGTSRQRRSPDSHFLSYIRKWWLSLVAALVIGQLRRAAIATSCHATGSGGCACCFGAELRQILRLLHSIYRGK